MIKKIIFYLIVCFLATNFLYGKNIKTSKSISQVKRMKLVIEDSFKVNKEFRKTEYSLKFIIPDIIKKEIILPELNKGEIYVYNKGKKMTYLPMFNQKKIENITTGENTIIEVINYIFDMEKKDKNFKTEYYARRVNGIKLGERTVIVFKKFNLYDGYLFPEIMSINEDGQHVGDIKISKIEINPNLNLKEFQVEE
ncbi:LolA family protein [Fusobacterium sp. PH5-44]|uniref:LolA family protein n=1 Tax=unclassified Fusobacterium TaxID=2648384 RepID=UPI003D213DFE